MSALPSEQEQLLRQIADPPGGTHGREAARAKLDALIAREFTASLAELSAGLEHATRVIGESLAEVAGELVRTRKQMADSSVAASRHQRALVIWMAVLAFATLVYAVAGVFPFFGRSFATPAATGRAWVLWEYQTFISPKGAYESGWQVFDSFVLRAECAKAQTDMRQSPKGQGIVGSVGGFQVTASYTCLPDTVDPRGPKRTN